MEYNFEGYKFKILRNKLSLYNSILKLYKETSNYKSDLNFIENKYNTSLYGKSDIGFLAFDESNIAAYYGVFPMRLTQFNTNFIAAQSGDTLTHPNYQKKGLFTFLAQKTYELAREQNIDIVFGFPNKNSLPGFQKKLNWEFHDKIKEIVIPVKTLPLGELSSKFAFLNNFYRIFSKSILKKYTVEASQISLEGFDTQKEFLRVKKDLDFFQYKKYSEANLIKIDNFIIYLKVETHLIIGDVSFFEANRLNDFISTIKKLAQKLMVFKIKFYLTSNHWLFQYLKDMFPQHENNNVGFCVLKKMNSIELENALFTASDFDTF